MDTDSFWTLLEDSRQHGLGGDKRDTWLRDALAQRAAEEIVGFQACLDRVTDAAFTWNLWAAADRIFGGWCSDDAFRSFQHWMIGLGRAAFEAAVTDPDVLLYAPEVVRLAGRPRAAWTEEVRPGWPALDTLGLEAYELATGPSDDFGDAFYAAVRAVQCRAADHPGQSDAPLVPPGDRGPSGRRWCARDEEEAARRLPGLSAMFPLEPVPGPGAGGPA
jgi:hypothetical protein